jgi:hypothetical protein
MLDHRDRVKAGPQELLDFAKRAFDPDHLTIVDHCVLGKILIECIKIFFIHRIAIACQQVLNFKSIGHFLH